MTTRTRHVLSSIIVSSLAACATTQSERVRVDQIEGGLPNCQAFAWHTVSGDAASFNDQRVRSAVMEQLQAKGYREGAENPDCRIAYRLTTREIPQAKPGVGVGVGGGSGGIGGGIGVSLPIGQKSGFAGTFALDVIDAAKNAQIWSGTLETELAAAEVTEEEARDLATEVLSAYPNPK